MIWLLLVEFIPKITTNQKIKMKITFKTLAGKVFELDIGLDVNVLLHSF
jgi:hypothetical protein